MQKDGHACISQWDLNRERKDEMAVDSLPCSLLTNVFTKIWPLLNKHTDILSLHLRYDVKTHLLAHISVYP